MSGNSTPSRFTSQSKTTEELLQSQTTGLVNLSDYRKRRLEAIEQTDRAAHDAILGGPINRAATPSDGTNTPVDSPQPKKKKSKKAAKATLSFGGVDDEEEQEESSTSSTTTSLPLSQNNKKKITPNTSLSVLPRSQTKKSLLLESTTRETLRKQFLALQARVKAAEIAIPFVFYDGGNIPGGVVRVRKGEFVWVFLDGSRKVGALGGANNQKENQRQGSSTNAETNASAKARREWARVGVDDLMLVRGEIIIPHHYDFHYFILNKTVGPGGRRLFAYSSEPPPMSAEEEDGEIDLDTYNPLSKPGENKKAVVEQQQVPTEDLEGADADPSFTKVVDRRWYEKNKHIYPASIWQEFDPEKDYANAIKKDAGGNTFFFS